MKSKTGKAKISECMREIMIVVRRINQKLEYF